MIGAVAEFCAGLGDAADRVVVTAYHMPENLEELGGEAPIFGERNSFHVLVEGRPRGRHVGWHGTLAVHFVEDSLAVRAYGDHVAHMLRRYAGEEEAR